MQEIDMTMQHMPQYSWEIIMVNDGVPNDCWREILRLCKEKKVKENTGDRFGICLSRNFGQHSALMAGIRQSRGAIVICLDDDGQTPADEAEKLIAAIENGADVCYAQYDVVHRNTFRSFGTKMNDFMARKMLNKPRNLSITSYFAMRRYVADEVARYQNSYPYLIGLILRTTTNIVNVPVRHRERTSGRSGYTLSKLLGLWLNGFTSFSVQPLRAATFVGVVVAVLGFLYGIYTIIKKLVNPNVPLGFSALMTAIVFLCGMIMIMVGMAGEYIGRTYISVNSAPQYVIRETSDDPEMSYKGNGSISPSQKEQPHA